MNGKFFIAMMVLSVFSIVGARAQADLAGGMDAKTVQDVTRALPSPQDTELNESVQKALQEDELLQPTLTDVQLKTVNGTVHLKGTVDSESQRKAIEDKVRGLPGVSGVKNFIHIAAAASSY